MAQSNGEEGISLSVDRNSFTDEHDSLGNPRRPINEGAGDVEIPLTKAKKRAQIFADSDSDFDETTTQNVDKSPFNDKEVMLPSNSTLQNDSDSSSDTYTFKNHPRKSRIRNISDEEDSLPSSKTVQVALKNKEQQARMTNKRDKLRGKFKNFINSREKDDDKVDKDLESDDNSKSHYERTDNQSENSEDEGLSIEKLKQVSQVYH